MNVKIESTKIIKPILESPHEFPASIPLSVFDKVTYNTHMAVIYAYRPPTPPNETIQLALQTALSEYREWAGRLGQNDNGDALILLNGQGVKFVEATADIKLDQLMPLKPSPVLLSLHPSLKDVEEIAQVQLTRFTCGSLVVGFTSNHLVADGHSTSNFLVAWGKASRGLKIDPLPIHDGTIFTPREPPVFEFDHRGVEFKSKNLVNDNVFEDDIVVHKVHFTRDFISKLKARASASLNNKSYSTFESVVAHLWRKITKARGLGGLEKTHVRISANGRMRMNPKVPNEYFGNLVLWAFPTARVKDLVCEPVSYAAKLIHDAVTNVNDSYFKSFIDFATHKVEEEDLVPTTEMNKSVLCPNLEVDSWLRFPFYELDFGGGSPYVFMPSYFPIEGMMFLTPSFIGDGSIDAFVPLFHDNLTMFKHIVYVLD
ncbi:agmatine hydroxycinnamoyltransferase 1-like [Euphorbia lathyris]|uniref:agmatine hydroxycinnamoyltransferase 1-like n=1 Tax=Euphorbia lathyris TaxID=212925 RepID=UPI00331350B5